MFLAMISLSPRRLLWVFYARSCWRLENYWTILKLYYLVRIKKSTIVLSIEIKIQLRKLKNGLVEIRVWKWVGSQSDRKKMWSSSALEFKGRFRNFNYFNFHIHASIKELEFQVKSFISSFYGRSETCDIYV